MSTEIWIDCDVCGRAFGGPGLHRVMFNRGWGLVCLDCMRKLTRTGEDAHRVAESREASERGTTAAVPQRGA
jgi:ribosome-binding protein aMBF1 (putative translation factor)